MTGVVLQDLAQSYVERPPIIALADVLASVWVQRVALDSEPYAHRTIPHGSVELSVELGSAPRLVGPQTVPVVETLAPGACVVGVRFHRGVAPVVLGLPASELVDVSTGADELWGGAADALGASMAAAASAADAAALLEHAIVDRLADAPPPDPLVLEAVRALLPWGATEVSAIPAELHISERQLRRRMLTAIGHPPKALQRMLRFQGFLALAHARAKTSRDLGALAAESGYADQAHLTRESHRLSGLSPGALLRESDDNCVDIHDHGATHIPLLRNRARRDPALMSG